MNRWVDQTQLYQDSPRQYGNCVQASVASLLFLPLEAVPAFHEANGNAGMFWESLTRFLNSQGYELQSKYPSHGQRPAHPDGLHLVSGPTERSASGSGDHMVIYRGKELVFDPHPSHAGLTDVSAVYLLLPLDPAEFKRERILASEDKEPGVDWPIHETYPKVRLLVGPGYAGVYEIIRYPRFGVKEHWNPDGWSLSSTTPLDRESANEICETLCLQLGQSTLMDL
jgi:hypothetical protein